MEHWMETCFICRNNFDLKYGRPCISKVPLFKATKNKEFASKLCGEQIIILSDILKSLNLLDDKLLSMIDKRCTSVCKKCVRKIVNCGSLFQELRSSITLNCPKHKSANEVQVPDRECDSIVEGKRSLIQSSPSGFTPVKKAAKKDENNDHVEYRAPKCAKSRKSLFNQEESSTEHDKMNDAIANLMCLPVQEKNDHSCIVKVRTKVVLILQSQVLFVHSPGF